MSSMVTNRIRPRLNFTLSELALEVLDNYPNKSSFVNDAILRAHLNKFKVPIKKTKEVPTTTEFSDCDKNSLRNFMLIDGDDFDPKSKPKFIVNKEFPNVVYKLYEKECLYKLWPPIRKKRLDIEKLKNDSSKVTDNAPVA